MLIFGPDRTGTQSAAYAFPGDRSFRVFDPVTPRRGAEGSIFRKAQVPGGQRTTLARIARACVIRPRAIRRAAP